MLIFEHSRTENIVNRLVRLANAFRVLIILFCLLFWAGGLAYVAALLSDGAWYIGAIAGGIIGYLLGMLEAALVATGLEWMSQVLISQGEIIRLATTRK
ncbi:hypothetical protein EHM76_00795 [bacterium]|nr:MAG: hypothetical protein EHM76_00795 [bacterium]